MNDRAKEVVHVCSLYGSTERSYRPYSQYTDPIPNE